MDLELIAVALGDVAWIALAFALGFMVRAVGLPPMVGFIAAGFALSTQLESSSAVLAPMLSKLAELGVTLLLFTIGLKLNLRALIRPEVWAVTVIHMAITIALSMLALTALALLGLRMLAGLDWSQLALIGFALSFSSTVFVAKVLETRGEMASLHGRIAIGILIMQDIVAVGFLAAAKGQWPSPWALLILPALGLLRTPLIALLKRTGHGELLVLYGFLLALGGAKAFELVGLKGDLGALVIGALIAGSGKAEELAKTMLGFKDLFLLGFFLSIGLSGSLNMDALVLALAVVPLLLVKSALYLGLLLALRQRARTSLLTAFDLTNFSEFGLIVAAVSVQLGWLSSDWLVVLALALAFSFVLAAGLSLIANRLYNDHRQRWHRWQRTGVGRLHELRLDGARVAVVGMGGIGSGAYDNLTIEHGQKVIGIEIDPRTANNQKQLGRRVLHGDPSDADFWDRIQADHTLELVVLALPHATTSKAVIRQLKRVGFAGEITAMAKFADEAQMLLSAGADSVFDVYAEAGAGFAAHVLEHH